MKTFEEAMRGRHVRSQSDFEAGKEAAERYMGLIEEITTTGDTKEFLMAMVNTPCPQIDTSEESRFFSLLMSAFVNGVMIGIDMEKSD